MSDWSTDSARRLYNIGIWDEGYAGILENGHLAIDPLRKGQDVIDLVELIQDIRATRASLPVHVRFLDILHDRVNAINEAFNEAFDSRHYQGGYTSVYPIKVNQERAVVDQFSQHRTHRVGLEAGSKTELIAVLASLKNENGLIVCNGYKDSYYIRLALLGQLIGHEVYIVTERLSEARLAIEQALRLGIKPKLGVRIRLSATGKGNWQSSGGMNAKFGLSARQVIELLDYLSETQMLDCLNMLHFHMGSQIADLEDMKTGFAEGMQYYNEIKQAGAGLSIINVGGGLGVDYESTRSDNMFSINYNIHRYAGAITDIIAGACDAYNLEHPDIFTESGRAMTAHHAVLVSNIIETETSRQAHKKLLDSNSVSKDLKALREIAEQDAVIDNNSVNRAKQLLITLDKDFSAGKLTLYEKALADQYRVQILHKASTVADLDSSSISAFDKYFMNFSVFQSVPDVWGIGQIFPVMPLQRLHQKPDHEAVLHDLTCDSDGQIEQYPVQGGIANTLPLHEINEGEDYLVGIFMVGAYQEILGDMHNFFGDTWSVNIKMDANGRYQIEDIERGESARNLLDYAQYDTERVFAFLNQTLADRIGDPELLGRLRAELAYDFDGYTYHEKGGTGAQ